jgi:integrase
MHLDTERDYLKPDEAMKLLHASKEHYLGAGIWLAILSGLRTEAIRALRWQSVDFDKGQILIREAFKEKEARVEEYPKGKKWEYVPMPPALADFLRERRRDSKSTYVAPGMNGGLLNYKIWLYGVRRLCKEASVPVVSPHELRQLLHRALCRAGGIARGSQAPP